MIKLTEQVGTDVFIVGFMVLACLALIGAAAYWGVKCAAFLYIAVAAALVGCFYSFINVEVDVLLSTPVGDYTIATVHVELWFWSQLCRVWRDMVLGVTAGVLKVAELPALGWFMLAPASALLYAAFMKGWGFFRPRV